MSPYFTTATQTTCFPFPYAAERSRASLGTTHSLQEVNGWVLTVRAARLHVCAPWRAAAPASNPPQSAQSCWLLQPDPCSAHALSARVRVRRLNLECVSRVACALLRGTGAEESVIAAQSAPTMQMRHRPRACTAAAPAARAGGAGWARSDARARCRRVLGPGGACNNNKSVSQIGVVTPKGSLSLSNRVPPLSHANGKQRGGSLPLVSFCAVPPEERNN